MDDLIIIGLGSNLGEPKKNLEQALEFIESALLKNITRSKIYNFPALMPKNAPPEWNINFANMVIAGQLKKQITPLAFLKAVKDIEAQMGRVPAARWAPRVIDIDILAWGDQIVDMPDLIIPHYAMLEREFVLLPLNEIAPNWQHPITKKIVADYVHNKI